MKRLVKKPFFSWAMTTILASLIIGMSVFGDNGVLDYLRMKQATSETKRRVEQLERENRTLRKDIEALKNDNAYIEKVAREKLNMVRPDEVLYQFDKGEKR